MRTNLDQLETMSLNELKKIVPMPLKSAVDLFEWRGCNTVAGIYAFDNYSSVSEENKAKMERLIAYLDELFEKYEAEIKAEAERVAELKKMASDYEKCNTEIQQSASDYEEKYKPSKVHRTPVENLDALKEEAKDIPVSEALTLFYYSNRSLCVLLHKLSIAGIKTLAEFLNLTPEEFRNYPHIGQKYANVFQEVRDGALADLDKIIDDWKKKSTSQTEDFIPKIEGLSADTLQSCLVLPINAITYYHSHVQHLLNLGNDQFSNIYIEKLTSNGKTDIRSFLSLKPDDFKAFYGVGATKVKQFCQLQKNVEAHLGNIKKEWDSHLKIKTFPLKGCTDKSFYDSFMAMIDDILDLLKNKYIGIYYKGDPDRYEKYYAIIKGYFKDELSFKDIGNRLKLGGERCRQIIKNDFLPAIFKDGNLSKVFGWENIHIDDYIMSYHNNEEGYLFCPKQELENRYGKLPDNFLKFIGLDIISTENVSYMVPEGSKIAFNQIVSLALDVLRRNCVNPLTEEEFVELAKEQIEKSKAITKDQKVGVDQEETLLVNLLRDKNITYSNENEQYLIYQQFLKTNQQRLARIVMEAEDGSTREEVFATYQKLYPEEDRPSTDMANLRDYNVYINNGNNRWYIGQTTAQSLPTRVAKYAEEKVVFTYDQIKKDLITEGYRLGMESDQRLRVYITNCCAIDLDDSNHFCFRGEEDGHSEYRWSAASQNRIVNWVFNQIKDVLDNRDSMPDSDVRQYIRRQSEGRYHADNVLNILGNLKSFKDSPFVVKNGEIVKSYPNFENTDFRIYKLPRKKFEFFRQIKDYAVYATLRCSDHRIKLVDFQDIIANRISPNIKRNTIINAIEDSDLSKDPLSFISIDGLKYIQLDISNLEYTSNPASVPQEHEAQVGEKFDWIEVNRLLKEKLALYSEIFEMEVDPLVDKFTEFLKNSDSEWLNSILPQDIYDYFKIHSSVDECYVYLNDLCRSYFVLKSRLNLEDNFDCNSEMNKCRTKLLDINTFEEKGEEVYKMLSEELAAKICDFFGLFIYMMSLQKVDGNTDGYVK